MRIESFVGPSNRSRSRTYDSEQTINWYVEVADAGTPRAKAELLGTPGCTIWSWGSAGPNRGLFEQDGRAFTVTGTQFGELPSTAGTAIGNTATVAGTTEPVTFASNGQQGLQVLVTSGGLGYVFNLSTNTLTQIADGDFPGNVTQCEFFEGYGVVLVGDSDQFQISALEDMTDWDPLDVYQRNIGSDNFVAMVQNQRELWFFGRETTLVYTNTGNALTPLQPIPGLLIQHGCLAQYTAKRADNSILWLGRNEYGQASVYAADGYTPARISTFAVEQLLSQSADLSVAVAWVCQLRGHTFYVLHVPDLPFSPVFDLSVKQWVDWADWDTTDAVWLPYVGRTSCAAFGQALIGDKETEGIYALDFDAYDLEVLPA